MRALWVACELSPLKLQDAASFPLVRAMMKFLASLTAAQSFFIVYNITSRTSPQSRRYGFVYCVQRKKRAQSGTAGAYDDEKIFGIPASVPCTPTGRRSSVSQFSLIQRVSSWLHDSHRVTINSTAASALCRQSNDGPPALRSRLIYESLQRQQIRLSMP